LWDEVKKGEAVGGGGKKTKKSGPEIAGPPDIEI
jgi:hypothetical protein